jgi:tellurite methyltransferase
MNIESNWDSQWEEESKRAYWQEPAKEVIDLKNRLNKSKFTEVLDLGCGIGRHAILFAKSGFRVTAVDYSQEALNILQQKASEKDTHINIIRGSYSENIFPEESFNLVISYNVLYHGYRDDFKNAISIIHKYLRPEGLFFFTCPTRRDEKYGNGEEVAENTYKSLNSVHPGDIHYFAGEEDITDFLSEFESFSKCIEEHYWDNQGTSQFSSNWQVLATK